MCKNIANKFMASSMAMLCACWTVRTWYWFHVGTGNYNETMTGYETCASSDGMENPLCQMYAAAGTLSALAAMIALGGGFYTSFQKNQAHMSAAFSLLNLALSAMWFVFVKELKLDGHDKLTTDAELDDVLDLSESVWVIMGLIHLVGFLFGIVYTFFVRCSLWIREDWQISKLKNNFNYVAAMFFYCIGQAIFEYNNLDIRGCSTDPEDISNTVKDEFEKQIDGEHEADYSNRCASHAVGGSFLLLGVLACFIALALAFCQEAARQGRVQQFALAFSVGMACLAQTTMYWYGYSNARDAGESFDSCTSQDAFSNGYCTALAFGGLFSLIGFPLALFTAFAFLCGCMTEQANGVVIYTEAKRKGVTNV